MRLTLIGVSAIVIAGCATAPQTFDVKNKREYQASKDVVWERLIRYFATNNIQVKTLEKASGVVYAERELTAASTWYTDRGKVGDMADCGKTPFSVPLVQTIQLNVYVREESAGKSSATVTVTFREFYNQQASLGATSPVTCNSTGVLETKILDVLAQP